MEKQLEQRGKLDINERSNGWKRAVFFHSTAWPFVVCSVVLFSAFLKEDQLCATQLDFGFAGWRRVVVYIATYFPLFVLFVDLMMNRLVLSHKHLLTTTALFLLYIGGAWIGSQI